MYEYFTPVMKKEHMLYSSELGRIYKIYTTKKITGPLYAKSPHSRLITEMINDYAQDNNIPNEVLFAHTLKGLARVYPKALYEKAMEWFFVNIKDTTDVSYMYTTNKGIKFRFCL